MGKTAFVTGSGSGIGRGIALQLAEKGYDVGLHYRSSIDGALTAAEEIRAMRRKACCVGADLADVSQIQNAFDTLVSELGVPEIFVNNAGLTKKSPFLDTTPEMFDELCGLDFKGTFFCVQEAARRMRSAGIQGSIVIISSNNAYAHFADVSVYGSVKAAVGKLTEHAALELAKYGIRVNSIAPGWTDTGAARLDAKEDTFYKVPLQRWTTPEEIGKAVLFLSSEEASSITGIHLVIDGGALLVSDKEEKYGYQTRRNS